MNVEETAMVRAMADRMEAMQRELSVARNRENLDDTGFIAMARRSVGDLVTMDQLKTRLLDTGMATQEQLDEVNPDDLEATLELVNFFVAGGR